MTDRTCLDVAANALASVGPDAWARPSLWMREARAALDAIHPALADLTPADVALAMRLLQEHERRVLNKLVEDEYGNVWRWSGDSVTFERGASRD